MNIKLIKNIFLLLIILIFTSCGGGSSQSNDSDDKLTQGSGVAYFIDSAVGGLSYIGSSGISGKTDINGKFSYDGNTEIKFYVGNAYIGAISSINIKRDKKVFIQDIVGVDRAKTFDRDVIKIARVLQSLDSDNIPENGINIQKEIPRNVTITSLSTSEISTILSEVQTVLVPKTRAKTHLDNVLLREIGLNPFNDTSSDTVPPVKPTITYPDLQNDNYNIEGKSYCYFIDNSPDITVNGEIETQVVINNIPKENVFIDVNDDISLPLEANGADGYYEYNISLKDLGGNISDFQTIKLVKETTPPATPTWISTPSSLISGDSITVEINTTLNDWEKSKGVEIWTKSDTYDWTRYLPSELDDNGKATVTLDTSSIVDSESRTYNIKLVDKFIKKSLLNRTSGTLAFTVTKDKILPSAPTRVNHNLLVTNNMTFNIMLIAERSSYIVYQGNNIATVPDECGIHQSECEVSVTLSFPTQNDGNYTFDLFAKDRAGNISSDFLRINASKDGNVPNQPTLNSTSGDLEIYTNDIDGNNKETIKLKCSKTGCENDHYSVYINDVDTNIDLDNTGEYDYSFDLATGNGTKIYRIRFVDNVGRSGSPSTLTLIKDSSSPSKPILLTQIPNNNTTTENNITIKIQAQESDLDVLVAGIPQNIKTDINKTATLFLNIGSSDITRNFGISLRDKANNISPTLTITMRRDTTAPTPPIVSLINPLIPFTNQNNIVLNIQGEVGSEVLIGGHEMDPNVILENNGSANITLTTAGADGTYSYDISLKDIVDNTSSLTTRSIYKDTLAPNAPIIDNIIGYTNQNSVTMLLKGEAETSIFVNDIDINTKIDLLGQRLITFDTGGADGEKVFSLKLKDNALNESQLLSFKIIKDTVPPNKLTFIDVNKIPTHTLSNEITNIGITSDIEEAGNSIYIDDIDSGVVLNEIGNANITLNTSDITNRSKDFNVIQKDKAGNESEALEISIFKDDYYLMMSSAVLKLDSEELTLYFTDNISNDSLNQVDVNDDLNITSSNGSILGSLDVSSYISNITEIIMQGKLSMQTSGIVPYYEPNKKFLTAWNKINIKHTLSPNRRISSEIEGLDNIPPPYYASIGAEGTPEFKEYKGYEPSDIELYMPVVASGQTIAYLNTPVLRNTFSAEKNSSITYSRDDGACSTVNGMCSNTIIAKGCTSETIGGDKVVKCTGTHLEWRDDDITQDGTKAYDENACNNTYASKNDWRVPTINELITISDKSTTNPSIDGAFTDYSVGDKYFWSNTRYSVESPIKMWVYGIYKGNTYYYLQDDSTHVYTRCVRGIDLTIK